MLIAISLIVSVVVIAGLVCAWKYQPDIQNIKREMLSPGIIGTMILIGMILLFVYYAFLFQKIEQLIEWLKI